MLVSFGIVGGVIKFCKIKKNVNGIREKAGDVLIENDAEHTIE